MPRRYIDDEDTQVNILDRKLLSYMVSYAKPYIKYFLIVFALLLVITATRLLGPYIFKVVIDNYLNSTHLARAVRLKGVTEMGILFFGITFLGGLLNFFQSYILTYAGQRILYDIRNDIFVHLQKMSLKFFDNNPVGRLVTRITNDTDALNDMFVNVLVFFFQDILVIAGTIVVMIKLDMSLALLSLIVVPIIAISTIIFRRYDRKAYRMVRTRIARIYASLSEYISGMRIIQIFHNEKMMFHKFDDTNKDYRNAMMYQLSIFAVFRPLNEFYRYLALTIILWIGGGHVLSGVATFGVLFAFVNYIDQLFRPIIDLSEKYDTIQSSMAAAEKIYNLLNTPEDVKDSPNPIVPKKVEGKIEFKNVWFAYVEDQWVLKDISFTIEPGQTVAFVGATGAGKSSIISLIGRLYDIQKGEILIDGINIKDIPQAELRHKIAVVLQDVFLFTGDIKANIRLNNTAISDEEIKSMSEYVNADKFIQRLPKKYDEPVTERGSTLSQGQRQLIAFARALAFNPSILVLDEATANIDTETELLIQDSLEKLSKNRTTIVVAHRLSTIQHADKIIVIHKGRIREMGNHQELLANKGIYYKLYEIQYANNN